MMILMRSVALCERPPKFRIKIHSLTSPFKMAAINVYSTVRVPLFARTPPRPHLTAAVLQRAAVHVSPVPSQPPSNLSRDGRRRRLKPKSFRPGRGWVSSDLCRCQHTYPTGRTPALPAVLTVWTGLAGLLRFGIQTQMNLALLLAIVPPRVFAECQL